MSFTSASTSSMNVTVTWVYSTAPVEPKLTVKEQRRRERIRKWHEDANRRADAWLEQELTKIRQWSEANSWRPSVSHMAPSCALHYWTLHRSNEEDPEVPHWRTIYNRFYNKGWLGLTINCPTPSERKAIDAVLASIPKKNKIFEYLKNDGWKPFREDYEREEIGRFTDYHMEVWLAKLEDHNRLVAALESQPRISHVMKINREQEQSRKNIARLFKEKGMNYRFIEASESDAVIFSEADETTQVMLRLFGVGEINPI
jgi:hypothetical protein